MAQVGREDRSYAIVEFVQRQAFAMLTQLCRHEPAYVRQLLAWILRSASPVACPDHSCLIAVRPQDIRWCGQCMQPGSMTPACMQTQC